MTDYSGLVERLRERTFAKTPGMQRTCEEAAAAIEAQRERIERLEGALRDLLEDTQHYNHNCGDVDCPVANARAALETKL